MTTREINKVFNLVVTDPKQFSLDYRQNSNTQASNITFPVGPVVVSNLHFRGHRGAGLWTFSQLNITGSVKISDCVNIIIDTDSTVDSWEQESGDCIYKGTTVGDGNTHYKVNYGQAIVDATLIDQTSPSNYSVIAGGEGVANVRIEPGTLTGLATLFDLKAEIGGVIYYAGDLDADGVTYDPASQGQIMDQTGTLVGGQRVIRDSFMHIASKSGSTVFPSSSIVQMYDLQAFEADTTNRPVLFTQNTLGFDPLKANGGFDISWIPVGFHYEMWMVCARATSFSINQYLKFDTIYFDSSDVEIRHAHGNSNWIQNDSRNKCILRDYRRSLNEDYFTVGSFADAENSHFSGGQDNEFTIVEFSFLMLRGFQ